MTKKNLYFATVIKRTNAIKYAIVQFSMAICSWPCAILEPFLRTDMGERHFLLSLNILLAALLTIFPFGAAGYNESVIDTIGRNLSWFMFIGAYLYFSIRRFIEIKRSAGVFDFQRYSLSPGLIDRRFYKIRLFGITPTPRIISIYYEPALVALVGIALIILKQPIGYVIIACSIIYSISWAARFYLGDQYIMDKIDEMICNEEMTNTFVDNLLPDDTRGFEVHANRPRSAEFRRKVAESMIDDEPAVDIH